MQNEMGNKAELSDLLSVNFEDGTLVEYKDGFHFGVEYGRAKILSVTCINEVLDIKTDGEAYLRSKEPQKIAITKKDGVFYLNVPYMWCYALAPAGVNIPAKPTYDEWQKRN